MAEIGGALQGALGDAVGLQGFVKTAGAVLGGGGAGVECAEKAECGQAEQEG